MIAYGFIICSMIFCNSKCFIMRKGWISISSPHSFPNISWLDWFLNLCGLFMRFQEITYQIIGFKSNFIRPNQWIFLATQTPFHSRFFFLKVKKTKPRKDNEKIKLYVNISHAYVAEIIAAVKLFSQGESLLISGGPFFNFGTAQPSFGATSNLYLLSHVLKNCFEKNKKWSYCS